MTAAGGPAGRWTHLDKVLWPAARPGGPSYSKRDYLLYLGAVAPHLLPHLQDRPLVLTRYPDGVGGPSFYQKRLPPWAPAWLRRFRYAGPGGSAEYLVADRPEALLWIGQQAALEFHPWLARCAQPERPDRAVIDLDPSPPAGFDDARAVALVLRDLLLRTGVASWPKTSGATGLHLFIPIAPQHGHAEVVAAVRAVGLLLERLWPERVTLERRVDRRGARVYFDYLQNARGRTLCAPYSPRPLPGAPVSTPLDWSEVSTIRPEAFDLGAVTARLASGVDPFRSLATAGPQDLRALRAVAEATVRSPGAGTRRASAPRAGE